MPSFCALGEIACRLDAPEARLADVEVLGVLGVDPLGGDAGADGPVIGEHDPRLEAQALGVLRDLLNGAMQESQRLLVWSDHLHRGREHHRLSRIINDEPPDAGQEAENAFDTLGVPGFHRFEGAHEHLIEP